MDMIVLYKMELPLKIVNMYSKKLDKLGINFVEINDVDFRSFKDESYFKDYSNELSNSVNCPIILVGGNSSTT